MCKVCVVHGVCLRDVHVLQVVCECGECSVSEECALCIACEVCGVHGVSLGRVCALYKVCVR